MAEFTKCSNEKVNKWLEEQIAMCQPESVVWIDGSESQLEALRAEYQQASLLSLTRKNFRAVTTTEQLKTTLPVLRTEHLSVLRQKKKPAQSTTGWSQVRCMISSRLFIQAQ